MTMGDSSGSTTTAYILLLSLKHTTTHRVRLYRDECVNLIRPFYPTDLKCQMKARIDEIQMVNASGMWRIEEARPKRTIEQTSKLRIVYSLNCSALKFDQKESEPAHFLFE